MSSTITFNGVSYSVPATGDENWSDSLTLYLIAIASGALQKTGGTFTLTAETDFGATYGLKSAYFKSRATNPSSTGIVRLGNNEGIGFRNAANNADLVLKANASNILEYNGNAVLDTTSSALNLLITNAMVSNSAAIAYSKLNLGTSIVNADISVSAAIAYSKLNLGTSIVNADVSTSAAIALSKLAALTTDKVLQSNASTGAIEASSVSTTTLGYLDATSSIQTQLDARIAKSLITTKGDLITATASSTPARQAVGTDGQILVADSTQTNGIKWATANSGSKNYFIYNSFENNATTGWSLGTATLTTNFPSGTPTFGSGASGNLSLSAVAGSTIAGTYALSYASSATTTAGNFVASDAFTIDAEDQAKPLAFKFSYKAAVNPTNCDWSGTTSNSFGVAIYDVTNSAWIQPAGCFSMVQSSGVGIASGSFQTSATGTSYRICVYNANATSGAATVYMDSFFVGPQTLVTGAAVTDWVSYTPSTGATNTTYTGKWRRVGDSAEIVIAFAFTGAPSSFSQVAIPTGMVIDTSKIGTTTAWTGSLGTGFVYDNAGAGQPLGVLYVSTTNVQIVYEAATTNQVTPTSSTAPYTLGNGDSAQISFKVPIVGWSSNVQLSSDTDTRVVAMRGYLSANQTGINPNNSAVKINFDTRSFDTHAGLGSNKYTIPVSGKYSVKSTIAISSTNVLNSLYQLVIYKNGSVYCYGPTAYPPAASTFYLPIADEVDCVAGDYIEIYLYGVGNNSASTLTAVSGTSWSTLSVERLSGPSVVAASESVNARFGTASVNTMTSGVDTLIDFNVKSFDSHNAVTTGASWKFTAPMSGRYRVAVNVRCTSATYAVSNEMYGILKKNGSVETYIAGPTCWAAVASYLALSGSSVVQLLAGDYVTFYLNNNRTAGSTDLDSNAASNYICIDRIGNY